MPVIKPLKLNSCLEAFDLLIFYFLRARTLKLSAGLAGRIFWLHNPVVYPGCKLATTVTNWDHSVKTLFSHKLVSFAYPQGQGKHAKLSLYMEIWTFSKTLNGVINGQGVLSFFPAVCGVTEVMFAWVSKHKSSQGLCFSYKL